MREAEAGMACPPPGRSDLVEPAHSFHLSWPSGYLAIGFFLFTARLIVVLVGAMNGPSAARCGLLEAADRRHNRLVGIRLRRTSDSKICIAMSSAEECCSQWQHRRADRRGIFAERGGNHAGDGAVSAAAGGVG